LSRKLKILLFGGFEVDRYPFPLKNSSNEKGIECELLILRDFVLS